MQKEDLLTLANEIIQYNCEMQNVEVKSANMGCPTKLFDTLSSFSNQDGGGTIIFGLDEKQKFKIVGVYDPQDLMHKIAEQCKQMQPNVRPLFTVAEFEDKMIVSAEVPGIDVADRPCYYKGAGRVKGSFIRVGEADELMSDYEIYSYDAYHRRIRDDNRPSENADVSCFDHQLILRYISMVKENKPNLSNLPDDEILNLLGIVKNSIPTLAGVLCFSKYPQAFFPQLCITAVVVPGTELGETGTEGERFIANKRIEGTIGQMLEEAMVFIRRNMRVKTIVNDEGKRADKDEYPLTAVRETILNALMHRDYSIHTEGTPVRILMYYDRLEIINTGGLYGKLTLDGLGKIHADTRNHTLTNILEILKIAENRYSGIPTIRREMKNYKLPQPIFENKRGTFIVTLKNSIANEVSIQQTGDLKLDLINFCKTPRSRDEIAKFIGKTQYYVLKTIVNPLIDEGRLRMTIPKTPKSRSQKYVAVE